jgi:hypothetical protein
MVTRVQLLQALARHVGIDRRRGDIRVSKQKLYDAKVGAVIQQMGCERVTEHVR